MSNKTTAANPRASRTGESRTTVDDRRNTDPVRGMSFATALFAERLPNLPDSSDYHYFWGSTTNNAISIQRYLMAGYEVVTKSMLPAMTHLAVDSDDFGSGAITCNEMVALRVHRDSFQATMTELHHLMPAEKVRSIADGVQNMARQHAAKDIGDGTQALMEEAASNQPPPLFED